MPITRTAALLTLAWIAAASAEPTAVSLPGSKATAGVPGGGAPLLR